jgi:hypothetical protein
VGYRSNCYPESGGCRTRDLAIAIGTHTREKAQKAGGRFLAVCATRDDTLYDRNSRSTRWKSRTPIGLPCTDFSLLRNYLKYGFHLRPVVESSKLSIPSAIAL